MKKLLYPIVLALIFVFATPPVFSQVLVSDITTATANPKAMLDVQSITKGFLFPRMTQGQRNAIANPPASMFIFQTDNTPGVYFNAGTSGTPDWQRLKESREIGGLWSPGVGNDIYYTAGNVGIGNATPASSLDVVGDINVSGSPGAIEINATTGNEPILNFGYEGSSMFNLNIDAPASNPYLSVSTDSHADVWGVSTYGRVWHDYRGSVQAYVLLSSANRSTLFINNDHASGGGQARGINCAITDNNASDSTISIGGWNNGEGSGVYGQQGNPLVGDDPNYGYLGTDIHGAYGEYGANSNHGHLGSEDYGAYGIYDSESFAGYLGTDFSGVLGTLGGSSQNLDNGDFGVVGYGVFNSTESGSSLGTGGSIGAVLGTNNVGVNYSFGVLGYSPIAGSSSGGVMGIKGSSDWGALGYRSSSSTYGGYFVGGVAGDNKSQTNPSTDIGIGAFGDLFGAHINGSVYGLYAEGENYGSYTHGDVYRTGADVHLQMDNTGANNVMYTLVSPEMTVQTYGIGQMQNGKASIIFDEAFANIVSNSEPVIVTITPIGKSKGVYLDAVDSDGFRVEENENGKSSIQFTWIAIGKRAGYENMSLPADVIASDYNEKIRRGLSRDGDPNAPQGGEGLYYQNGELHLGQLGQPKTSNNPGIINAEIDRNIGQDKESLMKSPAKYTETQAKGKDQEQK